MQVEKELPVVATHMGVDIRCDESGQFHWQIEKHKSAFWSMRDAVDAIEKYFKRQQSLEKVKLSVPVLNFKGQVGKLTGVHSGNAGLLITPKIDMKTGTGLGLIETVIYSTPTTIKLVAELAQLTAKADAIRSRLKGCTITELGYREREGVDWHEQILCQIERAKAAAFALEDE